VEPNVGRAIKDVRSLIYLEAMFRFSLHHVHPRSNMEPVDVALWVPVGWHRLQAITIATLILDKADQVSTQWYGQGLSSFSQIYLGPIELEREEPFLVIRAALNLG
jgi:hypothetical protein